MPAHEPWRPARAAEIIAQHQSLEGPLLPILHALQAAFGHLSDAALLLVAETLNLTRAEVYGVVSFYHDFRREPAGRHRLQLCRAEACQSVGAEALGDHARRRLGVDWHGTSADGRVTLDPVYCLGLCASGPAALLDGAPIGRLDPAALDARLAEAL